jgi:Glycosyl transferases group 1
MIAVPGLSRPSRRRTGKDRQLPTPHSQVPALLVGYHRFLESEGGGVQICSRDYAAALEAAGFRLRTLSYDFPRGLGVRILRRLYPQIWYTETPPGLLDTIADALGLDGAEFIFFQHTMFAGLSRSLRQSFPTIKQVLLSHGAEGIDFCIEQRIRRDSGSENRFRFVAERMIGQSLMSQMEQRRLIDAVLTLSPLEVEIEKWLGCPRALWVPRVIMDAKLDLLPVDGRVGCVSTLDHLPNQQGLLDLFDALAGDVAPRFRFRLVGAPPERGNALAARYPFVDYLGALSDAQLRREASTWCCFVHPMFVYAKGCSTKLGVALGWGLPIATTEYGARGYLWERNLLPLAQSPAELARLVLQRSDKERVERHRLEAKSIADLAPDLAQAGEQIRQFLFT